MPDMNGYQLCQVLKDNPETHDIQIIFISALSDTNDKVRAFNKGIGKIAIPESILRKPGNLIADE